MHFGARAVRIWAAASKFPSWLNECSQLQASKFQTFDPWWLGCYVASKRQDPITQWNSFIIPRREIKLRLCEKLKPRKLFFITWLFSFSFYLSVILLLSCRSIWEGGCYSSRYSRRKMGAQTGLIWIRIETSSGLLRKRPWTLEFNKSHGVSWISVDWLLKDSPPSCYIFTTLLLLIWKFILMYVM